MGLHSGRRRSGNEEREKKGALIEARDEIQAWRSSYALAYTCQMGEERVRKKKEGKSQRVERKEESRVE